MTPVDYWYNEDPEVRDFLEKFAEEVLQNDTIEDDLKKDIKLMFDEGNVMEKSMALTVLAMIKKFF